LDRVQAIGYRVWETRPVVTKFDAGRLLLQALGRACLGAVRSMGSPKA
jgi:hypothetical protein